MKTAFVTGGAGFLGINLVELLVTDGWEVIIFDQKRPHTMHLKNPNIRWFKGDITDDASCERAMPEDVDAVFHLAGNTSHWKLGDALQTRVNVGGTRNMVSTALKRGACRFIYTSSIAAYGFQPERITENAQSTALSSMINYFRTKRLAEIKIHRGIKQGLDAVILNPANIIGPFDYGGWSRLFPLINDGQLPGTPPGKASFCHVHEVARAHILAFEKGKQGHNYLLGGADATWFEFVQQIGRLLNRKVPKKPTPGFILRILGRLSLWVSYWTKKEPDLTPEKAVLVSSELICSSEKAKQELGYKTVPLTTMLEDCHRWMIQEGLLDNG